MNVKKHFSIVAAALALLAVTVASCKKDEDEDKNYLDGTLLISDGFISYLNPGDQMVIYPYGVTHPDGNDLGLYYKTTAMTSYDTVYCIDKSDPRYDPMPTTRHTANFTVTAPDSLATFSLYVYVYAAEADNYWTSNTSAVFTVVDPEESIPQIQYSELLPSFTDPRDGKKYNYTTLDNLDWMTNNLAYSGSSSSKLGCPYMRCEAMRDIFGTYYTWNEAVQACPEGWRLPTANEWDQVGKEGAGAMMIDAYFNTKRMWEFWPDVKITNSTGLCIIPTGYCLKSSGYDFVGSDSYACFWTSVSFPEDPSQALYKYIFMKENDLKTSAVDKKDIALNVRCVRETENIRPLYK